MIDAFQTSTGVVLTERARAQAQLPSSLGGVGMHASTRLSVPAFFLPLTEFRATGAAVVGCPREAIEIGLVEYKQALDDLRKQTPPSAAQAFAWLADHVNIPEVHDSRTSLRWWSQQIARAARDQLQAAATGRDRARLQCIQDSFASCWLESCPSPALGLRLASVEFCVLMKWWLGLPLCSRPGVRCPACAEAMEVFGNHLLCCRKGGFHLHHWAVVQQLYLMAQAQGLAVSIEVCIGGKRRPADLLVHHWKTGGPQAVDASVVHPLAPSTPFAAVRSGEEALERVEAAKEA